jgi:hypothetical protein
MTFISVQQQAMSGKTQASLLSVHLMNQESKDSVRNFGQASWATIAGTRVRHDSSGKSYERSRLLK